MTTSTRQAEDNGTKVTSTMFLRGAGVAAMVAGAIFAGIQPFHPADVTASVTTSGWTIVITLKLVMCLLFLVGIAGLYARQAKKAGRLGFIGFSMLSLSWWLQASFVFVELFVLPVLARSTPQFVDSYLGIVNGSPGSMNIGALPVVYGGVGVLYLLGGLVFGIATFRARILSRWAAGLLAVAAAITPLAALLPHAVQRYAAVPMGIALICLGYGLFSEKKRYVA